VQHLGDLVASLAQLSFAPLKKPVASSSSSSPTASSSIKQDNAAEEFVMTPELWGRLQEERSYFKKCFLSLINKLYQPLIIRELILLHGSARSKVSVDTKFSVLGTFVNHENILRVFCFTDGSQDSPFSLVVG
jgi:hypothetical protein